MKAWNRFNGLCLGALLSMGTPGCRSVDSTHPTTSQSYVLSFDTPCDYVSQARLETIDATLRKRYGMTTNDTAVGLLNLRQLRLAMVNPDRMEYAASVPKVGILFAWFALHPNWPTNLDVATRHELGLMVKASSNEAAAKFSRQMGVRAIQDVLNAQQFYDAQHGGGIWFGKHYGRDSERMGDPLGNHSHAATVRQLLHFYLLLEQGRLVSPAASKAMREIFASPEIPHDNLKFVKGLAGRDVRVIRKWGTWENWRHDSAVITGPGRHYILVALTHHSRGDDYLVDLAKTVDDWMGQ